MGDIAGPDESEPKSACKVCGRKFAVSSLSRHEDVCRKAANKKRKVFDSGKQRSTGSDVPLQAVKKVQQEIKQNKGTFKPPTTHWREKHEAFMSAVQAAKGVDFALKTGAPLPPPPKAVVPSDYVQCEFCGRNFSKAAADRHIPHCKESKMRGGVVSNPLKLIKKTTSVPLKPTTTTKKPAATTAMKAPIENGNKSLAPKSATTTVKSAGSQRAKSPAGIQRSKSPAGSQRSKSPGPIPSSAKSTVSRIPSGPKTTSSMIPAPTRRNPSPSRIATGGKSTSIKK